MYQSTNQEEKSLLSFMEEQKRGNKGGDMKYSCPEMADYLLPQARIFKKNKSQRNIFIKVSHKSTWANNGKISYHKTKCGDI